MSAVVDAKIELRTFAMWAVPTLTVGLIAGGADTLWEGVLLYSLSVVVLPASFFFLGLKHERGTRGAAWGVAVALLVSLLARASDWYAVEYVWFPVLVMVGLYVRVLLFCRFLGKRLRFRRQGNWHPALYPRARPMGKALRQGAAFNAVSVCVLLGVTTAFENEAWIAEASVVAVAVIYMAGGFVVGRRVSIGHMLAAGAIHWALPVVCLVAFAVFFTDTFSALAAPLLFTVTLPFLPLVYAGFGLARWRSRHRAAQPSTL